MGGSTARPLAFVESVGGQARGGTIGGVCRRAHAHGMGGPQRRRALAEFVRSWRSALLAACGVGFARRGRVRGHRAHAPRMGGQDWRAALRYVPVERNGLLVPVFNSDPCGRMRRGKPPSAQWHPSPRISRGESRRFAHLLVSTTIRRPACWVRQPSDGNRRRGFQFKTPESAEVVAPRDRGRDISDSLGRLRPAGCSRLVCVEAQVAWMVDELGTRLSLWWLPMVSSH